MSNSCFHNPENKKNWYILYTHPRAEKVVSTDLERKNYEVFLPLIKTLRVWKNRQRKIVEYPLFPNYIFVRTFSSELFNLKKTPKIATYLSNGNKPACISGKEINAIKEILNCETQVFVEASLRQGDEVRIIRGPLAGHEGILIREKGKSRFGIRLKEIRHTVLIEISIAELAKI